LWIGDIDMASKGAYAKGLPHLVNLFQGYLNTGGNVPINKYTLGRILATLNATIQQTPVTGAPPVVAPGAGDILDPPEPGTVTGGGSNAATFRKFFYPQDVLGIGASIGGRIANAVYKSKAAKQVARGNAAQHFAAALSTPQSHAIFGSPLGSLAKISADAGKANATKSLATGEAWQGSLQDISNFINTINTMRRLMNGDALSAMSLMAIRHLMNGQGRGP
jgi:hypothetical protein